MAAASKKTKAWPGSGSRDGSLSGLLFIEGYVRYAIYGNITLPAQERSLCCLFDSFAREVFHSVDMFLPYHPLASPEMFVGV